jgi:regulator of protease activity HflC (stomatin/prohibitin superfamily)
MVTIILVVLGVIIGAIMSIPNFGKYSDLSYQTQNSDAGRAVLWSAWRGVIIGVVVIFIGLIQPFSIERIDAGHKGIVVNLSGASRGVQSYQYKTGWVMYNSWFTQVLEFPTYQQHIEYDDQVVITKGGFSATIKPSFNYSLKEDNIGDMFVNLRLGIREIEQGWLKTAIIGAVNDVANTWEVDSIFSHREQFENNIKTECNKRLAKWFDVSQLRTNITPPEALQEVIVAKTKSIQQAQASEQQALAAIADGKRKVAVARADSAETIINAKAQALAMKLKQQELTTLYVEYVKAQAWDGKLPSTVAGGSGTFLNIK